MPVAALIPIALQMFQAIKQGQQAKELAGENKRPNYEIPQGAYDALDIKKNLALQTGLPRQDIIEQQLDLSNAGAMSNIKEAATSPWDVIKGSQTLAGQKAEKVKDIGIAGAQYGAQAKSDLATAFEGLSKLQETQWAYNQYEPYVNAMNTIRGLRDASTQNLYSGASNWAGVSLYNDMNKTDQPSIWDNIFGGINTKNRLEGFMSGQQAGMKYIAPTINESMPE